MRNGLRAIFGCGMGLVLLSGCGGLTKPPKWGTAVRNPSSGQESLAESSDDHFNGRYKAHQHDGRALVDDMDLITLTDRPSRLNRWHDR